MSNPNGIDSLKERVKELTCLYDISNLASEHTGNLDHLLQAITTRVSQAWLHNDYAVTEISLPQNVFISGEIPTVSVNLSEPILIEKQQVGKIAVHYPAGQFSEDDFLSEETHLLKKIALEVAHIIERDQRNEQEEKLKRSAERNDRLTILGEITAGIAHELNTPLGNILGFSQLIAESAKDTQILKDAQKITDSAIYAREVVKKLMFFSCEMPQQMQSIAINPLVKDAIKLLKPTLQNAQVYIELAEDPKNSFGRLDPIQITQVVFNMLINAIYASPAGSTIRVKLYSQDGNLSIIIADEGHGIPEEVREKIFEPFFTTKPVGEGSGLGLSVVHGIIKSHKGQIRFSSETGKGTTFNITLPLHP